MRNRAPIDNRRTLLKQAAAGQISPEQFIEATSRRPGNGVIIYVHLNGRYTRAGDPISQEQYEAEVEQAKSKGTLVNLSLNLSKWSPNVTLSKTSFRAESPRRSSFNSGKHLQGRLPSSMRPARSGW